MKHGVILAGGSGTRLDPLTKITNKHLLPIYDKQMIYYPLETMIKSGIKNVTIVGSPGHVGQFLELLSSGYDMGLNISYVIQDKPLGIAHAIWVALREIGRKKVFVMLGDNIFEDTFEDDLKSFNEGAKVFLKEVPDPERYGVADVKNNKVISIEEKPKKPKTSLAVVGAYLYDENAYDIIDKIKPSDRGEIEVTALNNYYIKKGLLDYRKLNKYWQDVGTFDAIVDACLHIINKK